MDLRLCLVHVYGMGDGPESIEASAAWHRSLLGEIVYSFTCVSVDCNRRYSLAVTGQLQTVPYLSVCLSVCPPAFEPGLDLHDNLLFQAPSSV